MAETKTEKLPRVFNYNGLELPDPDPDATPEQVKDVWSATYPELNTATITGPETVGGRRVFKFQRAIGTKG